MDILHAVVLGIVEGATEFLPISSTGHLIIASQWLAINPTETNKAFQVIIQLGAILATIVNYRDKFSLQHIELWKKVILAFLPIAGIGFLLHNQIKALFSVPVVAVMFILGGIIFLLVERFYKKESAHVDTVEAITYKQAFWIGIAQLFAVIPGTSRAGSSIIGALLVGVSRKASAEFSFLLALPVLGAAGGFDLLRHYQDFSQEDTLALLVGFVVAFVVAFFTMKLFISFLQRFTFVGFGIYRILFGAALLWFI